jgi:hypothetical protein
MRSASRTTTGTSAATAPLWLISGLSRAAISSVNRESFNGLDPTARDSHWPTHAVTPAASRPAATTNRPAMKMMTVSPKPENTWSSGRMPEKNNASGTISATSITGRRPQTNRPTTAAMMAKITSLSLKSAPSCSVQL